MCFLSGPQIMLRGHILDTILCFHVTSSFSKISNLFSNPTEVLMSSDIRPYQNLTFKLDRVHHFVVEDISISKFIVARH